MSMINQNIKIRDHWKSQSETPCYLQNILISAKMDHIDPLQDLREEIWPEDPSEDFHRKRAPSSRMNRSLLNIHNQWILLMVINKPREEVQKNRKSEYTLWLIVYNLIKLKLIEYLVFAYLPMTTISSTIYEDWYVHLLQVDCFSQVQFDRGWIFPDREIELEDFDSFFIFVELVIVFFINSWELVDVGSC